MTDDERIARLTALARRVWPDRHDVRVEVMPQTQSVHVTYEASGIDAPTGERVTWTGEALTLYHPHPRALDAFEAALLVLTGDVTMRGLRGAVLVPMIPVDRDAERVVDGLVDQAATEQRRPLVPAWVEQLAAALEYRSGVDQYVIDGDRWRELRARAKGGER